MHLSGEKECECWECLCVGEPWLELLADHVQLLLLMMMPTLNRAIRGPRSVRLLLWRVADAQTFRPTFSESTFVLFPKKEQFSTLWH